MTGLLIALSLLAVPPAVSEGTARAAAAEAAADTRFEVVSELDVAATADFAADKALVGGAGPSATAHLADAYDARLVLFLNLYVFADETHVAMTLRDVATGTVLARSDVGAVEPKVLFTEVRRETRTLLARVASASAADAPPSRLFVSAGHVVAAKALLVGKARRPARTEPKTGLRLVLVPAGEFSFGCVEGDAACAPEEKPPKSVKLDGFWIGQTEVTLAAWERCVLARRCTRREAQPSVVTYQISVAGGFGQAQPGRDSAARAFDHGLFDVSARQAEEFCAFMGGRLPTAMEWEYAAKAGRPNIFPWGNDPPDSRRASYTDGFFWAPVLGVERHVGGYRWGSNRWGLLDMAGNMYEWTSTANAKGEHQIRGGSYQTFAAELRTSAILERVPTTIASDLGFRCVVPVDVQVVPEGKR